MKPILFNTEMVRAILTGRKTVTRRVIKGANSEWSYIGLSDNMSLIATDRYGMEKGKLVEGLWATFEGWAGYTDFPCFKARYRPGEILYVRETWDNAPVTPGGHFRPNGVWYYKADGDLRPDAWRGPWRPSIHMPREAARIFLRVTDVRVERLKDMNATSAMDEGFTDWNEAMRVWNSAIKPADRDKYGWDANPWVWVISFERVSKEVQ